MFSYQEYFLNPFDAHGCNHVEYPEEAESVIIWIQVFLKALFTASLFVLIRGSEVGR